MEILVLLVITFVIVLFVLYKSYDDYGYCMLTAGLLFIVIILSFAIIGISGVVLRTH